MFNWLLLSNITDIFEKLFSSDSKKYLIYSIFWLAIAVASIKYIGSMAEMYITSSMMKQDGPNSVILLIVIPIALIAVGASWNCFAKWRGGSASSKVDIVDQERAKAGLPPLDKDERRLI